MNVGQAAATLGTTARMLRYREALGLISPERTPAGYRAYGDQDLRAAALAADIEHRYTVPPVALAFALRALDDPEVTVRLRELGRLARRAPVSMLDFEKLKAQRLLGLAS